MEYFCQWVTVQIGNIETHAVILAFKVSDKATNNCKAYVALRSNKQILQLKKFQFH